MIERALNGSGAVLAPSQVPDPGTSHVQGLQGHLLTLGSPKLGDQLSHSVWMWCGLRAYLPKDPINSQPSVRNPFTAQSSFSHFPSAKTHGNFKANWVWAVLLQTPWAPERTHIATRIHWKQPKSGAASIRWFLLSPFYFPCKCSVTLSCPIWWAICFCAMLPLALASNVLLIPQGAFPLEFKSMAELWLPSQSNAPVRYAKRKKKLECRWKSRTWLSLSWVYIGRKTEFCHCCSLWMLYFSVIAEELMWFNRHNNKYSLDKVIIP